MNEEINKCAQCKDNCLIGKEVWVIAFVLLESGSTPDFPIY
jgi:hypothetical protein